jgi:dCTP deaminase
MSVLSDKWIKKMALDHNMISPFVDKQIGSGKISYGLS